ncbi:MAG: helix-turn-helix transcriptional regulator [Gordonia sp. (in: high G+C Gram-positive bacteria)]|uniref:helix-turn-helix domain-containing protein n=1 Tax=Gordonia sp. (in: high G+C Gram-positive bacteria) TaxID=84139 RepID=UPI0039E58778
MAARDLPPEPRMFAVDPDDWPGGDLVDHAPAPAVAARRLAQNLRRALDEQTVSLRALAVRVGVDHATISRVIAGRRYCDIATLAKLEAGLGTPLWPPYRQPSGHAGDVVD